MPANRPGLHLPVRASEMPPLVTQWGDFQLWPAQITAIRNLEASLAANSPRLDPDGDGQRQDLHRHQLHLPADQVIAGRAARAVPGGPGNLAARPRRSSTAVSPVNNYKFGEFIVQHPAGNTLDTTARVHQHHPAHVQRCSRGANCRTTADEESTERWRKPVRRCPEPIDYNPASPSRPSTSSSPTRPTAASTTCGARCWSTSTPTSSA